MIQIDKYWQLSLALFFLTMKNEDKEACKVENDGVTIIIYYISWDEILDGAYINSMI